MAATSPRVALHALNRLAYGPAPGDVARVAELGVDAWIAAQLNPVSDPALDTRLATLQTLRYPISQVLELYNADQRTLTQVTNEFTQAKLVRSVHAENQLLEVMVDFWFNHFNVYLLDSTFLRQATPSYERDAIRPHALGRFRDLLAATAGHPAMLAYLDNYLSSARRINENYGRELLELHTVGVDAGYTQAHVVDAARAFTGWTIDDVRTSGAFSYRTASHDTGSKSVFGLELPARGQKGGGDARIAYLAGLPATARFIARKLAVRFVADDPPDGVVEAMTETFLATDGNIAEVLRRMVSHNDFWAAFEGTAPPKPKTPLEFVISAARALGAQVTTAAGIVTALTNLGMPAYLSVPPTGYSARGADWINPSSQLYRMNFALDLARGLVSGVTVDLQAAVGSALGDPVAISTALNTSLFAGGLSTQTMDAVAALSRQSPVSLSVRAVGLLLASPEFQVR